jgi:hypothetical protein
VSDRRHAPPLRVGPNESWSRRAFLRASVERSLLVGAAFVPGWAGILIPAPASPPAEPERETLRLVVDGLIPRGAGRPAASEAGGHAYLERRAAEEEAFARELERGIRSLDEAARAKWGAPFPRLAEDARAALLRDLERTEGELFATLRDAVYEAYYTRPEVWSRIGYEFHTGIEPRLAVERFDEAVLQKAHELPRWYREAP